MWNELHSWNECTIRIDSDNKNEGNQEKGSEREVQRRENEGSEDRTRRRQSRG